MKAKRYTTEQKIRILVESRKAHFGVLIHVERYQTFSD
jgi:hypothetical protein